MPDSSVNLASPTGTADTRTTPNGDQRQVVALGNDGDRVAGVMPWGALETFTGLSTLFYDSWSTSPIDTTEKWTVSGTAPTISGGNMTFATTAGYHAIRTKDTIRPNAAFTVVRNGIWLETTAGTGSTRFWGLGTPATTPSATVMAQEGVGFEVDQAGALSAVVYSAGAKTHTFPLTRPNDGAVHAYEVQFRVTGVTWHIDNFQVPVATQPFPTLGIVELPALLARFNVGTPSGITYTNIAHLTADTSRQGVSIMDPIIGTRQARVTAGGAFLIDRSAPEIIGTGSGNIFNFRSANVGTSAAVVAAAPAAGLSLYITDVSVSNSGATLSTVTLYPTGGTAAANGVLDIVAAASGGGGSMNLQTPLKLAAATGLSIIASAASTSIPVTVSGYTAP